MAPPIFTEEILDQTNIAAEIPDNSVATIYRVLDGGNAGTGTRVTIYVVPGEDVYTIRPHLARAISGFMPRIKAKPGYVANPGNAGSLFWHAADIPLPDVTVFGENVLISKIEATPDCVANPVNAGPIYAHISDRPLPDLTGLGMVYVQYLRHRGPLVIMRGSIACPGRILATMMCLEDFTGYYEDYMRNPDPDVVFQDQTEDLEHNWCNGWDGVDGDEYLAQSVVYMISMMVSLAMVKQFTRDNYEAAITNHCNGLGKSLNYLETPTSLVTTRVMLPFESIDGLATAMKHYPKLKATIYTCILNGRNLFCNYMSTILAESQLTVYNVIQQFISRSRRTVAHLMPEVLQEIVNWWATHAANVADFGDNWPYIRLLDDNTSRTAVENWPTLGYAACLWAVLHGIATFEDCCTYDLNFHPDLPRNLSIIVPDKYLTDKAPKNPL